MLCITVNIIFFSFVRDSRFLLLDIGKLKVVTIKLPADAKVKTPTQQVGNIYVRELVQINIICRSLCYWKTSL